MGRTLIIEKERLINADIKCVWKIVTETSTDWNGITIETKSDWLPGSDIVFAFTWNGKAYEDKGKIIQYEPERVFTYTYWSAFSGLPDQPENYSKVESSLAPDGNRTILRLRHSDFATQTMYEHSDKNWEETLDTIKEQCER